MNFPRRQFLRLAAGASFLPSVSDFAWDANYPARPVRIIVGQAAGGAQDIVARGLGSPLPSATFRPRFDPSTPKGGAPNLVAHADEKLGEPPSIRAFGTCLHPIGLLRLPL